MYRDEMTRVVNNRNMSKYTKKMANSAACKG